ncbi:hypothetical protein SNEBB_007864, partial [Seison nebaliae]
METEGILLLLINNIESQSQ